MTDLQSVAPAEKQAKCKSRSSEKDAQKSWAKWGNSRAGKSSISRRIYASALINEVPLLSSSLPLTFQNDFFLWWGSGGCNSLLVKWKKNPPFGGSSCCHRPSSSIGRYLSCYCDNCAIIHQITSDLVIDVRIWIIYDPLWESFLEIRDCAKVGKRRFWCLSFNIKKVGSEGKNKRRGLIHAMLRNGPQKQVLYLKVFWIVIFCDGAKGLSWTPSRYMGQKCNINEALHRLVVWLFRPERGNINTK